MYQLAFTIFVLFGLTHITYASEMKDYEAFQIEYKKAFEIKGEKNFFITEFKKIDSSLNIQYKNFVKKEKKKLTLEGNQMALDLEYLEPLRILTSTEINKDSCERAYFTNRLNNHDEEKILQTIKGQIESVCGKETDSNIN